MQCARMHFVFVYGTLKQGFPNHHLLPSSECVGECRTTLNPHRTRSG